MLKKDKVSSRGLKENIRPTIIVIISLIVLMSGKEIESSLHFIFPEGITVTYYNGSDFSHKIATVTKKKIQLGYSKKNDNRKMPIGDFSAVWEGFIKIPADDIYRFKLLSNDGSRLFIDEKLIIDHWAEHDFIPKVGKTRLKKGKYPIRIEYFNKGEVGKIRLKWYAKRARIPSGSVLGVPYISKW